MKKDWTYKKFEDCIENVKYTTKIQSKDYMASGGYPIISQEEELVSGYWNKNEDVFSAPRPLVVFGDHTRVLKYIDFDFVLGADGVKILLPIEDLEAKFLYYFLKWYNVPNLGYSRHYKLLKEISIPIPPLSIQRSIVAELDLLHSVISKKKEQLRELDDLAQSLFYQMFGDPITNPMGWEIKKLGEVAPVKSYQGDIVSEKGLYWLLNLDMVEAQTGKILEKNMLDKDEIGNSTTSFSPDNVLYSKLRPYLNKVVLPDTCGYCTTELLPLLPQKDILNREYLCYLLRSKSFVDYINIKVAGAKMPRVTMDDFRNFPIPLPPLSLQQSFAAKVSAIEAQKQAITLSIKETEALLAQRMDTYFS